MKDERERADSNPDALDAIGDALKDIASDSAIDARLRDEDETRAMHERENEIGPARPRTIKMIEVDRIETHPDARELDDVSVDQYVAYIRRFGAVDPIQVIERDSIACAVSGNGAPSGRYVIVPGKGAHRFAAQKQIGCKRVACVVDGGDVQLVIDAALASETLSNREIDMWAQFRSIVRWRDRHPDQSVQEIADATGVSMSRVTAILTVHDYVDPGIVEEKLSAVPDKATLSHLLELSRTGRDETPLRRRDVQRAEWIRRERGGWRPPVTKKKKRRPRTVHIRRKILHIDPDARLRGARLRKELAWVLGETVHESIEKAEEDEMKPKRKYASKGLGGAILAALRDK